MQVKAKYSDASVNLQVQVQVQVYERKREKNAISNVSAISSQNNQDPHQVRTTLYPQVRHNKTLNVY